MEEGEKDPTSFPPLTQRALLAHGILVLEGVIGELCRVMRGRVTVAGRPVEGDRTVSCGRGQERKSVGGESGTVCLNQNPGEERPAPHLDPAASAPKACSEKPGPM